MAPDRVPDDADTETGRRSGGRRCAKAHEGLSRGEIGVMFKRTTGSDAEHSLVSAPGTLVTADLHPGPTWSSPETALRTPASQREGQVPRLDRLLEDLPSSGVAATNNGSSADGAAAPNTESVPLIGDTPRPSADLDALALAHRHWVSRYVRWLVAGDLLVGLFAASAALVVAFRAVGEAPSGPYVAFTFAFPFLWAGALAAGRSYESRFVAEGVDEFRRVFDSAVRLVAIVALASYALDWTLARRYVILALPLATLGSLAVRAVGRRSIRCAQTDGRACHRVLVTGTERATAEMIRRLRASQDHPYRVIGALVDNSHSDTIEGVPVVGSSVDTVDALAATGADTVAVAAWSTFSQEIFGTCRGNWRALTSTSSSLRTLLMLPVRASPSAGSPACPCCMWRSPNSRASVGWARPSSTGVSPRSP